MKDGHPQEPGRRLNRLRGRGKAAAGAVGSDSIVEPPPLLDEDDGLGECVENGPEFTAKLVRQWLARLGVQTLYIEPGSRLEPSILAVEPA